MAKNEVVELVKGFIRRQDGVILEAYSSVTLVLCGDRRIIIDTSTPEKREQIVLGLEAKGLSPNDIDTVILTHLHGDHTCNNDLFSNAQLMAHVDELPPRDIEPIIEDQEICDGVHLIHTPGHTRGSMSVVIEADRTYVAAGDALPTRDNYLKWVPPGLTYYPELALKSMRRIVEIADVIIPGHDSAFEVDR
jgi:glyoxylase-like metal-dependent hydrolase (beta-lactamase superfamily II)